MSRRKLVLNPAEAHRVEVAAPGSARPGRAVVALRAAERRSGQVGWGRSVRWYRTVVGVRRAADDLRRDSDAVPLRRTVVNAGVCTLRCADDRAAVVDPAVRVVVGVVGALCPDSARSDGRAAVVDLAVGVAVVVEVVQAPRERRDVDVVEMARDADEAAIAVGDPIGVRIRSAVRGRVLGVAAAVDVEPERGRRDSGRAVAVDDLDVDRLRRRALVHEVVDQPPRCRRVGVVVAVGAWQVQVGALVACSEEARADPALEAARADDVVLVGIDHDEVVEHDVLSKILGHAGRCPRGWRPCP